MIADAERRLLRVSVSASGPMDWVHGSTGSDWLDENCEGNGWAMKKAALEQSASDAARQLFHPRAWVWETHEPSPSR